MSRCKEHPIIIQHDCHRMDPIKTPNVSTFLKFEVFRIFQVFQHSVPQPCSFCFSLSLSVYRGSPCDHWGCWNLFTWGNFSYHAGTLPPPPGMSKLVHSDLITQGHPPPPPQHTPSAALTGKRAVGLRQKGLLLFKFDKHWEVQSDLNSNNIFVNLPCHGKVDLCQK